MTLSRTVAAAVLALSVPFAALAADTPPAAPAADKLAPARAHIAAGQWRAAIDALKKVEDPGSADWNNLMGYSLRQAKVPDYAAAERHYDAALRIDPTHRGALEYSGELYLKQGDLAKAEQRLAALDKACRLPCAEYTDLKKAIAAFKSTGGRVATP